ncbi:unnamed protein product [Blepharisma stoltei]|uniref:Uncharacterized protein n=1 Tax=Blepharisma stoltei TaxID=1481888 RepID=A0AAU9K830_9CILI|nr:unnamed protein product [Blepharisma stoltei]
MTELTLRNKSAEILSRPNNSELEMDAIATFSAPQINPNLYGPPLMQACQNYLNAYQQWTYLYFLREDSNRSNLIIYNTETETQEIKTLQNWQPQNFSTCITQQAILFS